MNPDKPHTSRRKTSIRKAGPGFLLLFVFIVVYIILKVFVYPPSTNQLSYTNSNFYVFDLNIPANLEFCGEKIPSNDFDIRKDLEKEFFTSAYWKNNSLSLFKRAQRWFPYIEPILKSEGVPDDFKYLCVIESHLSNVSSHAGAAGFWQLVPVSAQGYGLEVSPCVDERYHLEKSTRAACQHIKDAYAIFSNWTLSAAAYNRGIGGIQAALAKQKGSSYYDLLLNKETGSFIYRILAYKTLLSSPGHFGIKKKKLSYYSKIPYKIYKVDSTIHQLSEFAKKLGCTSGTIRLHNPWLLCDHLDNASKKVYEIRVPKKLDADYSEYLKDLLPESGSLIQYSDDPVKIQNTSTDTLGASTQTITYTVKVNEPLKSLANFLKVNEADLRTWNGLDEKAEAVAGQTLVVKYSHKKTTDH